jgi:hypothetical protein
MSANRKASINKRARELAQKDGVRDREQRRQERKVRQEARAASGIVGPEMGEPIVNEPSDLPDTTNDGVQPLPESTPEG